MCKLTVTQGLCCMKAAAKRVCKPNIPQPGQCMAVLQRRAHFKCRRPLHTLRQNQSLGADASDHCCLSIQDPLQTLQRGWARVLEFGWNWQQHNQGHGVHEKTILETGGGVSCRGMNTGRSTGKGSRSWNGCHCHITYLSLVVVLPPLLRGHRLCVR